MQIPHLPNVVYVSISKTVINQQSTTSTKVVVMPMEDNTLPNTRFSILLSITMPPKRTPFASLQNGARVVKRRRSTAAKSDPMSSGPVKPRQQVPRVKVLKPSEKELVEQLPIPPEFDYFKSPFAAHAARPLLPSIPAGQNRSPLDLFCLFSKIPYSIQL